MNFWEIGLETMLKEVEDRFTKVDMYIIEEEGKVRYDEAMDLLRAIIMEVEKHG